MSAQDASKKGPKHSPEKGATGAEPGAEGDVEFAQEDEAVTEPEADVQPKSKARPEAPAKPQTPADTRRGESKPAEGKSGETKAKSMAQIMRFDRRAGKRRR